MKSFPALAETFSSDPARINLLGFSRKALEEFFTQIGEKPFRAHQLLRWIHGASVLEFNAMTDLSKALRARLSELCEFELPKIVATLQSRDGTIKWVMELADGNQIETVFIPEDRRGTLCVSSQVGCALRCAFCATAQQGFSRNLSSAEIVGQVFNARRYLGDGRITNVVLMGMGEPLLNFDAVLMATELMMDDLAYGLAKRRVTISTAGIVPAIDRLASLSEASLAVSLHATTDELRDRLVPINRKYPLAELLAACRRFAASEKQRGRKITFEYVMLEGINDSEADAKRLVKLLAYIPSKINLIPFNPVAGVSFQRASPKAIERFQAILRTAGFFVSVRRPRGEDIDAACGQLVGKVNRRCRPGKNRGTDETGL
jgi:23S rRNA (adenine2503-C2)-methyltransferase